MKIKIKTIKKGMKGLFANEFIHKGGIIFILKGIHLPEPTRTSIRVRGQNVEHYEGGFMNHHCDPNAAVIEIEDVIQGLVIAKKHIYKGEEITFDYETTEPKLAHPFKCNCHGKLIKGWNEFPKVYSLKSHVGGHEE